MANSSTRRPPSLDLVSLAFPTSQSQVFDEKDIPLHSSQPSTGNRWQYPSPSPTPQWSPYFSPDTARPFRAPSAQFLPQPAPVPIRPKSHYSRSSISQLIRILKPWLPLILYAITSLGFVVAIAFHRTELFTYLDELSLWLRSDEQYGHAILFSLILITTIPPIPLYSTLIVLSGYTFGPWTGALVSYFAALTGALVVFIISRTFFRESIERWLVSLTSVKRVVRAVEKRPKLLFLIRLAPYPYNVMNCLLAASPTLTLHTYTVCTALSLFKVIIHTSLGASMHSFRDYHAKPGTSSGKETTSDIMARIWTIVGIILCVLILIYLSIVARRAVDDELDDVPVTARDIEETQAFLPSDSDLESAHPPSDSGPMTEVPFRSPLISPSGPD